jgi:hypothetical protein
MSQENVEAVRILFAAFADRDFEAAITVLDPGVEIRPAIVGGPEASRRPSEPPGCREE